MPRARDASVNDMMSRLSQPSTSQMVGNLSQMSQLQSQTQSKAFDSMPPEEKEKKVNDLVQYLLVMDQKKIPIKKRDINKMVLKESSRAFSALMDEASQKLLSVFGFKVVELTDKFKGSYILVNTIENDTENRHLEWSELDSAKMGLLSVILSIIFMNGNVIEEGDLWHALKVFGINQGEFHGSFGDVKSVITEEFVKQGYLEIKNQANADATIKEYRWGQRAACEFKKRNALTLVSDIYQCEPEAWLHQWQQVQEEEGAAAAAQANRNDHEPMEIL